MDDPPVRRAINSAWAISVLAFITTATLGIIQVPDPDCLIEDCSDEPPAQEPPERTWFEWLLLILGGIASAITILALVVNSIWWLRKRRLND